MFTCAPENPPGAPLLHLYCRYLALSNGLFSSLYGYKRGRTSIFATEDWGSSCLYLSVDFPSAEQWTSDLPQVQKTGAIRWSSAPRFSVTDFRYDRSPCLSLGSSPKCMMHLRTRFLGPPINFREDILLGWFCWHIHNGNMHVWVGGRSLSCKERHVSLLQKVWLQAESTVQNRDHISPF